MKDTNLCQEIVDYLNSFSDIGNIFVQNEVDKARAAKNGQVLCMKDKCPAYEKRDNDGYGYRESGCGLTNRKHLIQHKICPHKSVKPYRYVPFIGEVNSVLVTDLEGNNITEQTAIGKRIKEAVDKVYEDDEYGED